MTDADLARYLAERKALVDAALDARLPSAQEDPRQVHEAMRYAVLGGGKRLRPILAIAVCEVAGAPAEAVLDAACAIELVHAASLILDDLPAMDDAPTRRGQPATHVRFGQATALLAVMGLLAAAFDLVARQGACGAVGRLAHAIGTAGLTGGQHDDLRFSGQPAALDQVERAHHRKAGALFVASVRIPAELLGLDPPDAAALESYARDVGLAFQIADDLRDARAGSEDTGKNTLVSHLGPDGARQRLDELVAGAQEAIAGLGDRADPLRRLADYVAARGD